jgi:hypothetical protein
VRLNLANPGGNSNLVSKSKWNECFAQSCKYSEGFHSVCWSQMLDSQLKAFERVSCCEICKVTRCIDTQVSGSLHKRTVEMVEALYTTNKVSLLW